MTEQEEFFDRIVKALWQADGHDVGDWHNPTVGDDRAIYRKRAEYIVAITGPVDPLYDTEAVAKIFSLSRQTIQDWINAGKIKAFKLGGMWRIPKSEILRISNDRHG